MEREAGSVYMFAEQERVLPYCCALKRIGNQFPNLRDEGRPLIKLWLRCNLCEDPCLTKDVGRRSENDMLKSKLWFEDWLLIVCIRGSYQ